MAQRLVRAKRKIRDAGIPYRGARRPTRCPSGSTRVLAVLYLVFNEGYAATAGDALVRRELCAEAIRLGAAAGRADAGRAPRPAALLALMLLHDARRAARVDADGELVLLEDQDRARWDRAQIARGAALVERALRARPARPYALQAAIAALHAQAATAAETDWPQIAALYERCWPRASPRRWSSSTARWRSPWPTAPRPGCA